MLLYICGKGKPTKHKKERGKFKMEKLFNKLIEMNTSVLVLAAIFTSQYHVMGNILFIYTSTIGIALGIKIKNKDTCIINSTFLALNLYFLLKVIYKF